MAICARVESDKRCGDAGWLHRLRDDDTWQRPRRRTVRVSASSTRPDMATLAERCAAAMRPDVLLQLAGALSLSAESLRRLRLGWSAEHHATTWPMTDADRNVMGIRLRLPGGRKLSVRGGREGLFIPDDLQPNGRLLVCEGPTDTAAMVDLGFAAVGRPSCGGGNKLLVELVGRLDICEAVIVADGDGPGWRGAENLASNLLAYVFALRLIKPPSGIKDARAWKQAGATSAHVEAAIAAATVRKLKIKSRRAGGTWTT